ncbi:K+-transporting ATPase ATPase B chain [Catenuloplanes nepalensis]|uniref:Potassium-transporting ATPase ATP-binding subunit n=1 Tax=Catenuloplanes nepalensis TaxID=587533 RepID=A0ABT9MX22_9ACTN|nr:potassium-transporting ATPase subunit KdpB [Catenuloplanes nepalensis]MDP9795995.1 K+-transporting ATPase ATPase B chain [Catenuloplanes nepalensis]
MTTTLEEPPVVTGTTPKKTVGGGLLDPKQLVRSLPDALRKLDPRVMWRNPVMLIVEIGAVFTTVLAVTAPSGFAVAITIWLWLTVIFANLAEAVAEGRGKAQAATLRAAKKDTVANRLVGWRPGARPSSWTDEGVAAGELRQGDIVEVTAGQIIPGDGDVVEGIASVDESAITGESAPVIRESGGDRSAVTGGTRVLSDRIVVRITQKPGESFIDRMISLVEGSNRQKTPNEVALNILLAALTIIFLLAVVTLQPLAIFAKGWQAAAPDTLALDGDGVTGIVLVSLLVCLIPTTIGALLSAIGIAGMDRLVQRNVLAMSGRAVEAAGDVSTLLLDKTGTITLGNRQASEFLPAPGVTETDLADAAQLSSLADGTPEGRSVVVLAKDFGYREREVEHAVFVEFTAQTRMSGVDLPATGSGTRPGAAGTTPGATGAETGTASAETSAASAETATASAETGTPSAETGTASAETGAADASREAGAGGAVRRIRKGAAGAVLAWVRENGGTPAPDIADLVERVSASGGTPLVVATHTDGEPARALGVIHLKDVVKPGMRERFDEMRRMGIRTVMITGDNPVTAKAIAEEAGVDDFLAEAKPEDKLALIRREQEGGRLVAMTGDGTNDAPALAQADVGVAMNTGTSAAKEAGNMVDLDSDPTKLIEIVEIGKQLLITRGALTTFSIANDIAKYFAIIPAMFAGIHPGLDALNIMRLDSPTTAILAAVIFNALVIVALIPLALRGVRYRPSSAAALLSRNLWIYGLGGIIAPFIGIKIIDLLISIVPGL